MTDDQNRIVEILVKYALYEPLSEEETRLLGAWRQRSEGHDALPDQLRDPQWIAKHRRQLKEAPTPILPIPAEGTVPVPPRIGWREPVLALVFTVLIGGVWLYLRHESQPDGSRVTVESAVVPADFRALLTREDGVMLVLDTVPVGGVVEDGMARKTDTNTLTYNNGNGAGMKQRLVVAEGSAPWRVLLADGSRILLHPGSSLAFSSVLREARAVLEGEAWFGIARDVARPLTIGMAGGAEVRVLGTIFDVRAGGGESKVLLYSGALRMRKGEDSVLVRPGEGAVAQAGGLHVREMTESERRLDWRGRYAEEDFFDFQNAGLAEILGEIGAWYGVRVSNPDGIKGVAITGKLPRSLSLEKLLKALERVEGGHARLLIAPNTHTILVSPGKPGG